MKLFKHSLLALILFGAMFQSQASYSSNSGYDVVEVVYVKPFIPHTYDCKATKTGGRVCNQYDGNGTWVRHFEENAQGKVIVDQGINYDKVTSETIYDEKTGQTYETLYTLTGTPYKVYTMNIKGEEFTQTEKIFDEDTGKLAQLIFYKPNKAGVEKKWIAQLYPNSKDPNHVIKIEFNIDNGAPIHLTNWVNDVKHGEEKFFKQSMSGKPKVVRTVEWNNGVQVK